MLKLTIAALAALPLAAGAAPPRMPQHLQPVLANACPEVAALYQPPTETVTLNHPGRPPLKVEVPKLGADRASLPPLYGVLMALELYTAPQADRPPPDEGVFQAMQPMSMPDNTFRSAVMRCDLSELWVVSSGGLTDGTRWYGPYQLKELMSARGGAVPQFR